jgi:PAS domain S-box-containing protein
VRVRDAMLSVGAFGPATVFALFGALLLTAEHADYPQLHDVLDTGVWLLSAVIALSLWDHGARSNDRLLRWLAISFSVTSMFELTHVLATVEWSGVLAPIARARGWVRPATWPPAAYLLPIGIAGAIGMSGRLRWNDFGFGAGLLVLGLALLGFVSYLPRYTEPGLFGITRPTLALVPLLWTLVGVACWRRRANHRIFRALARVAALLVLANLLMLYSQSPHDAPAMAAHLGKVCGYITLVLILIQWASQDAVERVRAEQALAATNATLERRVSERTAELQSANSALREEAATRREAEDALADSNLRKRAMFETALDGVVTIDQAGRITEFNPAAERIFGYSSANVIGQPLDEMIIPPDLRAAHRAGLARYLAHGDSKILGKRIELTGLRADGSTVAIELSINQMPGSGPPQFAGFLRDITERHEAQAKLHAQIARLSLLDQTTRAIGERQDLRSIFQAVLRSLENHLPVDFGCICLGEPGQQTLSVSCIGTRSSSIAQQLTLTEQTRIDIDENFLDRCMRGQLVYEPDIAASPVAFPARLAKAGLHSMVIAPLLVESEVFGVMIVARSQIAGFTSGECEFVRQVTEHVALAAHQAKLYAALQGAYEDLRQTQQAVSQQERLRALGQMASGIAHDINNALSPATLYMESLLERDQGLSTQTRGELKIIQRAIDGVANTVARMSQFSRPREDELTLAPVDLNEMLHQVVKLTRALWNDMPQQRGVVIRMETDLAADLPAIMGAESEIRDALTNLVLNAVDAVANGGKITLRSRVVRSDNITRVQLEVCDTGVGMSEEIRSHCLEPFFTTKGERGTGLGLSMVYGMVQRHSGELEILSEPGNGTTMRLSFLEAATSLLRRLPESAVPVRRLRILVVDDDPMLLTSLRDALERDGHSVTVADGGQAGIGAFTAAEQRGERFAVVITDLGMPYVDGRRVAAAIKALSALTPVILLTGWGHRLMANDDVPEYVDRVLGKPPKLIELRAALAATVIAHADPSAPKAAA